MTILNVEDVGYERLSADNIPNSYMININDDGNGTTLVITGNASGSVYSTILNSIRYCDLYYSNMHRWWK